MSDYDCRYLILDYETRSRADLRKCGGFEYAVHPSTEILCVAWRLGTREELRSGSAETRTWSPFLPSPYGEFKKALLDPTVTLVAHNAFFEQVITRYVLSRYIKNPGIKTIPIERWMCTASLARAMALPGKLVDACAALKLPVQKDMEGHRLMLKMSKPRRATKKDNRPWHCKVSDLKRLIEYCKTDIDAEVGLFLAVPKLIPEERKVWLLDQKINHRGFLCDRALVDRILVWIDEEMERFQKETIRVTRGRLTSTNKVAALKTWLAVMGCKLENMQKKTIADAIDSGIARGAALQVLKLRRGASMTSTAKFLAFQKRSGFDHRIRDSLVYHRASTGRFGGAGLQPHNFPQGTLKDVPTAIAVLQKPDTDLEWIRTLYGNPLSVFSSVLRAMILASPGKELFGGDYAGIEVRVLFWLAGHEDGLDAFRANRDLYIELASVIYKKSESEILNPSPERDVAKRAVLGCGFGMGHVKFRETCIQFGQEVTEGLAKTAVNAYRDTHSPVVDLWYNLERAAILAVNRPGKMISVNRTSWWVQGPWLYCKLPSGRRLAYYGPEVRFKATSWGEKKETLFHWDIHPKTGKWIFTHTYGGKLTENVVQATARDFMVTGMHHAEAGNYEILLTVHDELLTERDLGAGSLQEFEKLMTKLPAWGKGCPITAKVWRGDRWRK